MINVEDFKNGARPSKLYHLTSVNNLDNILKLGLLKNISKDNKCFNWCNNCIFMFDDIRNKDRMYSLYELVVIDNFKSMLRNFKNIEDITDLSVKSMVLCIDCTQLDEDKFGIDELIDKGKNGEIVSYTYSGDIRPEYISIETYMEEICKKESLREVWKELN